MWKSSEKKIGIKGLGTFIVSLGNNIRFYKNKNELISGVIQWYSWKDKQIEIHGDDGKLYLMELLKDPETGKWQYSINNLTESRDEI
jgi:hypothetical protein